MKSFPSKGILSRLAKFQPGEMTTAVLMLAYSFFAMASYNVIKPVTRSKVIDNLGSVNIPFVQLAAGFLIGFIMIGYGWLIGRLPRRWSLPITQFGIVGLLMLFWFLFRAGGNWVSVAFYLLGTMVGILLISQFWIFANLIYDPRQAKRLFGFIGAGAPLGGFVGYSIAGRYAKSLGSTNLLPISAAMMALCAVIVVLIIRREGVGGFAPVADEKGVGGKQALQLLRESKHLQIIALVISFASIGAAVIEQQVNMAAEATAGGESAIAGFLGTLGAWTSGIGFIIQILLTSQIHRLLGIGFALMILPFTLGTTGCRHPAQRRVVGAGSGTRARPVAAVHRRQNDAGNPVHASSGRHQDAGEAFRRCHRRPGRQGGECASAPPARSAVGTAPELAEVELCQPQPYGALGIHGLEGAARVPGSVPAEHRNA